MQVNMRFNRFVIFISVLMGFLSVSGQTQRGYVRTKGRLGSNGEVITGTRLQGATIWVKG